MDKIEVTDRARNACTAYVCETAVTDDPSGTLLLHAFARFERDILATRTDATPVAFISAERLDHKREFEANGAVVYDRPLGTSTTPLYTHPPATDVAALVEAAMETNAALERDGDPAFAHLILANKAALAPFTKG